MSQSYSNLSKVNVKSQAAFATVTQTSTSDLNFVETVRVPIWKSETGQAVIYSDKYCEQYGMQTGVTAANTFQKISLRVPYADNNYVVLAQLAGSNTTDYRIKVGDTTQNATDGFMLSLGNTAAVAFWRTAGYVSDSTMDSLFSE